MYALANVKRFVEDNRSTLGACADKILERAEVCSCNGIFPSNDVETIFLDPVRAEQFRQVVAHDGSHIAIELLAAKNQGG